MIPRFLTATFAFAMVIAAFELQFGSLHVIPLIAGALCFSILGLILTLIANGLSHLER